MIKIRLFRESKIDSERFSAAYPLQAKHSTKFRQNSYTQLLS